MNHRSIVRIALLSVLSLTSSACGFLFTNGPPPNHSTMNFFTCTQSKLGPGFDAFVAGFSAVGLGLGIGTSSEELKRDDLTKGQLIGVYAPLLVVSALSARSGLKKVNECREATLLLAERTRSGSFASATLQRPNLEALDWNLPQVLPFPFYVRAATENRPKQENPGGN